MVQLQQGAVVRVQQKRGAAARGWMGQEDRLRSDIPVQAMADNNTLSAWHCLRHCELRRPL